MGEGIEDDFKHGKSVSKNSKVNVLFTTIWHVLFVQKIKTSYLLCYQIKVWRCQKSEVRIEIWSFSILLFDWICGAGTVYKVFLSKKKSNTKLYVTYRVHVAQDGAFRAEDKNVIPFMLPNQSLKMSEVWGKNWDLIFFNFVIWLNLWSRHSL